MTIAPAAFQSFRGRPAPSASMKVRIYRNLNRPSLFSIVALSGEHKGKVLGYAPVVGISNVDLKVSEKQRHSVLEKQVRTVHAFAEGNLVGVADELPEGCRTQPAKVITYQPFSAGHFFDRAAPEVPIHWEAEVWSSGANLVVPQRAGQGSAG